MICNLLYSLEIHYYCPALHERQNNFFKWCSHHYNNVFGPLLFSVTFPGNVFIFVVGAF